MVKHWSEMEARELHYSAGPPRPARGKFPYRNHRSMEKVMIDERDPGLLKRIEEEEARRNRWLAEKARRGRQREKIGVVCRICKGKSPQWITGICPQCRNTGLASPPHSL